MADALNRRTKVFTVFVGVLPYVAGACLVLLMTNVVQFALVGILVTVFCTAAAYALRKRTSRENAAHWLIIDPFLYGFEFAFAAVLVHYVALGR